MVSLCCPADFKTSLYVTQGLETWFGRRAFLIIKRNQAWCEFDHAVFGLLFFIRANRADLRQNFNSLVLVWHADVKTVTCWHVFRLQAWEGHASRSRKSRYIPTERMCACKHNVFDLYRMCIRLLSFVFLSSVHYSITTFINASHFTADWNSSI